MNPRPFGMAMRLLSAGLVMAVSLVPLPSFGAPDSASLAEHLKRLPWRSIGPASMGGRIDQFAAVESKPGTFYVATASGGLFRTANSGTTWEPLFDNQGTTTIGSVAVAPSDPSVIWVGTGEANNRQSSSWGDGVYKSTDNGATWTNMGLKESSSIGQILIDPRNPNTVYVAAVGNLWAANKERGLYKTTDGGKTWKASLQINEDTGITDAKMDPSNPDIIYAAAYQRRRTAFGFNGGGPGSGLYRTTDGGATWTKLTKGLPAGDKGRIGIGISRKNPKVVYSIIEDTPGGIFATTGSGGVFRTEDGGDSWTKQSNLDPRPMYYSQVFVDPTDSDKLWVLGVNLHYSEDAGKTFATRPTTRIHSDFHAMWIDPTNPNRVLAGCDGGIWWTHDLGRTWDHVNNIPLGQFYEVAYDFRKPYRVYGGLQDNYSWGGPTAVPFAEGILNDDWINIGGGDGFHNMVDYSDDDIVYQESQNGGITRLNMATGERKGIKPRAEAGETLRFDWNTPMLISPHNPKKLLVGANRLFISPDRGESWRRTEDLSTKPDRSKMPIMGVIPPGKILSLDDGQDTFGQIICLTESSVKEGLIYVGCDDGNFQMSRDDGKTWTNITANVPGVPKGTYVRRLVASRHAEGRVYAAFDGHRSGDFKPYLLVSEDYGTTWRPITNGIPEGSTLHVIREHHRNPDLLFAGTERGAYVSFDRGSSWTMFPAPLPVVPVDDIQIHPRDNDLILATHGRSIYVLDNIGNLEGLAAAQDKDFTLFETRPAVQYRISQRRGFLGNKPFTAPNPPAGAVIQYYLKKEPTTDKPLRITILDKSGKNVISEFRAASSDVGINRIIWDMRYGGGPGGPARFNPAPTGSNGAGGIGSTGPATRESGLARPGEGAQGGPVPQSGGRGRAGQGRGGQGGGGAGGGGGFRAMRGPRVLPGTYMVRMSVGDEVQTRMLKVEDDPRSKLTDSDRKASFDALTKLSALFTTEAEVRRQLDKAREEVNSIEKQEAYKTAPETLKTDVTALKKRLADADAKLAGRQTGTVTAAPVRPARPAGEGQGEGGVAQGEGSPQPGPRGQGGGGRGGFGAGNGISDRVLRMVQSLEAITEAPAPSVKKNLSDTDTELKGIMREVNEINGKAIPEMNRKLEAAKLKPITPGTKVAMSRFDGRIELPVVAVEVDDEDEEHGHNDDDQ